MNTSTNNTIDTYNLHVSAQVEVIKEECGPFDFDFFESYEAAIAFVEDRYSLAIDDIIIDLRQDQRFDVPRYNVVAHIAYLLCWEAVALGGATENL